jgi:hypothetical protein
MFCFLVNLMCWVPGDFSCEPGHVYFVCVSLLCGVLCRYNLNWALFGGVGGGTVRIFLSLWLCSGGYGTAELVRGGWSVFPLLSSVCCQFSWRLGVCGRNFCVVFSISFGEFVVFRAVLCFESC